MMDDKRPVFLSLLARIAFTLRHLDVSKAAGPVSMSKCYGAKKQIFLHVAVLKFAVCSCL